MMPLTDWSHVRRFALFTNTTSGNKFYQVWLTKDTRENGLVQYKTTALYGPIGTNGRRAVKYEGANRLRASRIYETSCGDRIRHGYAEITRYNATSFFPAFSPSGTYAYQAMPEGCFGRVIFPRERSPYIINSLKRLVPIPSTVIRETRLGRETISGMWATLDRDDKLWIHALDGMEFLTSIVHLHENFVSTPHCRLAPTQIHGHDKLDNIAGMRVLVRANLRGSFAPDPRTIP